MKYKHKCTSSKELIQKLEEIIKQIRDHRSILVDWQEVEIPEETELKVKFKEDEVDQKNELKIKIEWQKDA